MNNRKKILAAFAAILLVTGFSTMAAAAGPVAEVNIGSFGINWNPKVSYDRMIVTVAAPNGEVFQKAFAAGVTPYYSLADNTGDFKDGSYTYELRVIPNIAKRQRKNPAGQNKGFSGTQNFKKTMVQSGYFTVSGGSIVTSTIQGEGLSNPMDIVHADDVIIDGSLCVGNDCYSGMAFGFDTIVLMENNLRIFFDDTSSIQNYPANDWRIILNDSTDGGGNFFAIEDATDVSNIFVLEAGAPSNSLYVDSYGDVGINTATPYYELHIVDGDSPCVRLDQDGSYGWTPQKWDLCGNESNFFIRDATHASKLPFRIEPDAPTNSIFIKSNGYIGMGTGTPDVSLEIETTGDNALIRCTRTDGATGQISAKGTKVMIGSYSNHPLSFSINQSPKVHITTSGYVGIGTESATHKLEIYNAGGANAYCNGGTWVNGSSRASKNNIRDLGLDEAVDALKALNPVKFYYIADQEEENLGFIAEDVPELVATKDRKGMSPMDVVAVLTKVVQEQQEQLQNQEESMKKQQQIIERLEQEVAKLEKK